MRALAALLLLAWTAAAGEVTARDLFVIRVTTERPSLRGPSRQTLEAVALPVGENGLLLAVGFALEPPDVTEKEMVKVTAIYPDGTEVSAELIGGDADLNCTLFRLHAPADRRPAPVALQAAARRPGDELVLLARHGELMRYAPRRTIVLIDAAIRDPRPVYAFAEQERRWVGAVAVTPEGRLVGFVDMRGTIVDGAGAMLGIGTQTAVVVAADAFAELARTLPVKDRRRAWLGVNLAPFDADKEAFFNTGGDWQGALVTGVAKGSPAARAGLRVHDLVRSIGALRLRLEKVEEWGAMLRGVQRLPLGKPLPVKVVRFSRRKDGSYAPHELELEITLAERPLDFNDAPETEFEELGLRVKPLTQDWRRARQVPAETTGVVVTRTAQASPARLAGLAPDDLVLRVDDHQVAGVESFTELLDAAKRAKRGKVVFFLRRGTETLFLALQTDW